MTSSSNQIFVIDDDTDFLELLQEELERSGYQVVTAYSLEMAQAAFLQHRPRLILSDYLLGDGTGLDLLETVKSNPFREQYFFLMSGNTWFNKAKFYQFGGSYLCSKPLDWTQLHFEISKVIQPTIIEKGKLTKPSPTKPAVELLWTPSSENLALGTPQIRHANLQWLAFVSPGAAIASKSRFNFSLTFEGRTLKGFGQLLLTHALEPQQREYIQVVKIQEIENMDAYLRFCTYFQNASFPLW
jgi:CheY-like chemotaxis protein